MTGGARISGLRIWAAGYEVLVVDDLSHAQRIDMPGDARFEELGIRNSEVEEVQRVFRPDVVSHHAVQAAVRVMFVDRVYDLDVTTLASLCLLKAHCVVGGAKFIYGSCGGGKAPR